MFVGAGYGFFDAVGAGWEGRAYRGGVILVGQNYVNITIFNAWAASSLLGTFGGDFGWGKNIFKV